MLRGYRPFPPEDLDRLRDLTGIERIERMFPDPGRWCLLVAAPWPLCDPYPLCAWRVTSLAFLPVGRYHPPSRRLSPAPIMTCLTCVSLAVARPKIRLRIIRLASPLVIQPLIIEDVFIDFVFG